MARYAMVTDLEKCVGCSACSVACRTEWNVPLDHSRTWIGHTGIVGDFPDLTSTFFVGQCNHCDDATCIEPCPTGATYQIENGIVKVDPSVCIGCGYCVSACPYDARYLNPITKKVDKCDFCESRVEKGSLPVCVTTCPANAKFFGDLENKNSVVFAKVFEENAKRIENENAEIGPNVFYLGTKKQLDLVLKKFGPRKPEYSLPSRLWSKIIKPFVFFTVGSAFAGQAIAFFHQLVKGEDQFDE